MAERNDIQPTNEPAAPTPAAEAGPAAATNAAPASAMLASAVPEIATAPALVPPAAPPVEITRTGPAQAESTAPEIKLPPVTQLTEPAPAPARSRFGRVLGSRTGAG